MLNVGFIISYGLIWSVRNIRCSLVTYAGHNLDFIYLGFLQLIQKNQEWRYVWAGWAFAATGPK